MSFVVINGEDEAVMSEEEILALGTKLFVDEAEETAETSECIIENEGVNGAIRLLCEYEGYEISPLMMGA